MNKFKQKQKRIEAITTASLPDIVFMLLFFFMVTTVMRDVDLKVIYNPTVANQTKKLENRTLVSQIFIGKSISTEMHGDLPRIQMNDTYIEANEIQEYIELKLSELEEYDKPKLTVSLKVDKRTEMGIVTDVKQNLRIARALKINYSTNEGDPISHLVLYSE